VVNFADLNKLLTNYNLTGPLNINNLPMLAHDALWLRYSGQKGPIDGITRQREYSFARTGVKLVGLLATIGLVALLFWIFPEYNPSLRPVTADLPEPGFYSNFFTLCRLAGPWMPARMRTAVS